MTLQLFGLGGMRGVVGKCPITEEDMFLIGRSMSIYLEKRGKRNIAIAKDTRISSSDIFSWLLFGIRSDHNSIIDIGTLPTHALALYLKTNNMDLGIMITASHNPYFENGIKLFDSFGRLLKIEDEKEIEEIFFKLKDLQKKDDTIYRGICSIDYDSQSSYIEFLDNAIQNHRFSNFKVVVDCANGSSFSVAEKIFNKVQARYSIHNIIPTGKNINDECGSLYPEKMCEEVLATEANLGICLDGDADRIVLIDEKGAIIKGDLLLAFLAKESYKSDREDTKTIVVTEYSNLALDEYLRGLNINVIRVKNGERNVVKCMDEGGYYLGGEYTGHIMLGGISSAGDGLLIALKVMQILAVKNIKASSINELFELYPSVLVNIKVKNKIPFEDIPEIIEEVNFINKELENGQGRLILRYSGTENVCRIMLEGKNKDQIESLSQRLSGVIEKHLLV